MACPSEAFEANMSPDTAPRPARILLCDDSPVERLALAHFLRGAGYSVDEAGDGITGDHNRTDAASPRK